MQRSAGGRTILKDGMGRSRVLGWRVSAVTVVWAVVWVGLEARCWSSDYSEYGSGFFVLRQRNNPLFSHSLTRMHAYPMLSVSFLITHRSVTDAAIIPFLFNSPHPLILVHSPVHILSLTPRILIVLSPPSHISPPLPFPASVSSSVYTHCCNYRSLDLVLIFYISPRLPLTFSLLNIIFKFPGSLLLFFFPFGRHIPPTSWFTF